MNLLINPFVTIRYVYWTDLDADNPTVERARLDGSERQSLKDQLNYVPKTPTNIAVDPQTNYVYWADTDDSVDQISRFDGVTDQFLNIHGLHDVIGLAIEDYIYWTDRGNADNALVRANKTNGDGAEVILRGYPGLLGLTSVILDRLGKLSGWLGRLSGRLGRLSGWLGRLPGRLGRLSGWLGRLPGRLRRLPGWLRRLLGWAAGLAR